MKENMVFEGLKEVLHVKWKISVFFLKTFLGNSKMDKKNVQKSKKPKQSCKKGRFVTIIEFFGLVAKKIIFIL